MPDTNLRVNAKEGVVGRFAPSPTGRMHAGNIFAALMSWLTAHALGGRIVLRIEDLDIGRSRKDYADQIQRDFEFLGLTWDEGPFYQQGREEAYQAAFEKLADRGLVYPCFCSRADLHSASAPHRGEKLVYAGTCRRLTSEQVAEKAKQKAPAWRLKVDGGKTRYIVDDMIQGRYSQDIVQDCGDYLVKRSDGAFAYQLAVVVDDAAQGVNLVTRGMDLLCSTPQQLYLQDLLGFDHPEYCHVPLVVGQRDRRLSKRDADAGIDQLCAKYGSAEGIIGHIAYVVGLQETDDPRSCDDLLKDFDIESIEQLFVDKVQILWH